MNLQKLLKHSNCLHLVRNLVYPPRKTNPSLIFCLSMWTSHCTFQPYRTTIWVFTRSPLNKLTSIEASKVTFCNFVTYCLKLNVYILMILFNAFAIFSEYWEQCWGSRQRDFKLRFLKVKLIGFFNESCINLLSLLPFPMLVKFHLP